MVRKDIYIWLNQCGINTEQAFNKFNTYDNEQKGYIVKHYEELAQTYKYFKGFIKSD